jgi:hypothetical protein
LETAYGAGLMFAGCILSAFLLIGKQSIEYPDFKSGRRVKRVTIMAELLLLFEMTQG